MTTDEPTPRHHPGLLTRRLNVIALVLSLIAIVATVYKDLEALSYQRCQAHLDGLLIERTRIITDIGAVERAAERSRDDALDAVFLDPALLKPNADRTPEDRARVAAKFSRYLSAAQTVAVERAKADKARADNPPPPTPSTICGA